MFLSILISSLLKDLSILMKLSLKTSSPPDSPVMITRSPDSDDASPYGTIPPKRSRMSGTGITPISPFYSRITRIHPHLRGRTFLPFSNRRKAASLTEVMVNPIIPPLCSRPGNIRHVPGATDGRSMAHRLVMVSGDMNASSVFSDGNDNIRINL